MTEEQTNWDKSKELADKAFAAGNYQTAEDMWLVALRIAEYFGDRDPRLSHSLESLANLYRKQKKYEEAEQLYWQVVKIKEHITHPTSLEVGRTLNLLAAIFYEQHKYTEAESIGKQVLSIFERDLGFNHPAVGSVANNLSRLYRKQGKHAQAKYFADKAASTKTRQ